MLGIFPKTFMCNISHSSKSDEIGTTVISVDEVTEALGVEEIAQGHTLVHKSLFSVICS